MPDYVVELVSDALNQRRRLNGATILALGVAYKGGVSDTRESPELEVLANSSTELRRSRYSCDSHRPDLEASVRVETCPPESKREKSPGSRGRTMARASARLLLVTATVFFASTVPNPALAQTAVSISGGAGPSLAAGGPARWPWATSMATGGQIWRWPTSAPPPFRCS